MPEVVFNSKPCNAVVFPAVKFAVFILAPHEKTAQCHCNISACNASNQSRHKDKVFPFNAINCLNIKLDAFIIPGVRKLKNNLIVCVAVLSIRVNIRNGPYKRIDRLYKGSIIVVHPATMKNVLTLYLNVDVHIVDRNAAIEAAHAGEAGKGFAVFASSKQSGGFFYLGEDMHAGTDPNNTGTDPNNILFQTLSSPWGSVPLCKNG